ncbi:MAG: DUF1343 domain-containing protein [Myxococcota bacterium]|nr:DUF1343 domain-containing protein [Myxococcota bacterium]
MPSAKVVPGLSRLLEARRSLLAGKRVGLICNASTVTPGLEHAADIFAAASDFELVRLFGPEHGIRGDAQDMIVVGDGNIDSRTGLPVHSLYGQEESSLWPPESTLEDLDVLVFDIQDVGARYYTYVYTMAHAMEVAGRVGVPVIVCDRPNPIGGQQVEGNIVHDDYRSFVGRFPLPNRHGMTAGELARFFRDCCGHSCDLEVLSMEGWERSMHFSDTGLPWVQPSPNMPTQDTALVYPGMCFFEGTLLSEGRGHTRPFEVVGAPFVDGARWAKEAAGELTAAGYEGFGLRPLVFQPTFHKHAEQPCGGVQVHITDRGKLRPVMLATALLKAAWRCWPEEASWRTERYEYVETPIAIDLLGGSGALRQEVEDDTPLAQIQERWDDESRDFLRTREDFLAYR